MKHRAADLVSDVFEEDREFDEAIELSAAMAGDMARGLIESAKEFPHIACPRSLSMIRLPQGMLVESDRARWIIRETAPAFRDLVEAMIRPELFLTAGSC